jgi:hypothetical protein
MKSNIVNSQPSDNPRKINWKLFVPFIVIGISVFILCTTGFSKIVLACASLLGIASAIYLKFSSREQVLVGFFSILGVAGILVYAFFPQSNSPFGWDKVISMWFGAVIGQTAFMAYFRKSNFLSRL